MLFSTLDICCAADAEGLCLSADCGFFCFYKVRSESARNVGNLLRKYVMILIAKARGLIL